MDGVPKRVGDGKKMGLRCNAVLACWVGVWPPVKQISETGGRCIAKLISLHENGRGGGRRRRGDALRMTLTAG